jgi:hypothetical protein
MSTPELESYIVISCSRSLLCSSNSAFTKAFLCQKSNGRTIALIDSVTLFYVNFFILTIRAYAQPVAKGDKPVARASMSTSSLISRLSRWFCKNNVIVWKSLSRAILSNSLSAAFRDASEINSNMMWRLTFPHSWG